jgi:hypothetical protein
MRKDLRIIRNSKRTWVAVYAIDCGITWLFMRRTLATSRRLEVTSPLDTEEGEVNMDLNA